MRPENKFVGGTMRYSFQNGTKSPISYPFLINARELNLIVPQQLNIFVLLFGAVQGMLLSFWFLRNKKRKISTVYLSFFLFVVGLQLTFKVITKTWVMEHAYVAYCLSYKIPYLIGPLLFLFAKSQREEKWKSLELVHTLPFLFFTGYLFYNWPQTDLHPYTQALIQGALLIMYTGLAIHRSTAFVRRFIMVAASAEFIIVVTLAVMHVYYGHFPDVRMLFIVLTFFIYWISYNVLSGSVLSSDVGRPVMTLPGKKTKYAHSSLKPAEANRIERELLSWRDTKKFTDPDLTVDQLAASLQTSRHHLSQVMNERLHKTYTDYIGELRLEEACSRLKDPANLRYTISAVALDSGFNSVSTFNDAFKKKYGITPSRHRDSITSPKSA